MIRKIAVLGAGTMGHSIAEAFALYDYPANLYEPDRERREGVKAEIKAELELLADMNAINASAVGRCLGNITLFSEMAPVVSDRDYVVEPTPENLALKQELFECLDKLCRPGSILASNASSLPLSDMIARVPPARRERMLVYHWFNPAHLIPLVELSHLGNMPAEIFVEMEDLFRSIGKQMIKVRKDLPRPVANRIMQAVARETFSLVEQGAVDAEDIDRAIKFRPAFRYATTGQLEVADFGGLDVCRRGQSIENNGQLPESESVATGKGSPGKIRIEVWGRIFQIQSATI
jgi:3-hydroxybutyryl-CoA dehydrogenase